MSFENPSVIGYVNVKPPSSAHEEAPHKVKIEYENPSVIGDVNVKPPSSAHEETAIEVKIELPLFHLDGQTSKFEAQAIGEQLGTTWPNTPPSNKPRKAVESPDWLPKGWLTEIRIRESGHKDKYYRDPVTLRQFRSRKEVLTFLEKAKLDRHKPTPKMKSEGEFRNVTKGLCGTSSEIYSSASKIGGISPHSASHVFILPSRPCIIPSSTTCSSDLLVPNYHTSPLPSSLSPTFGFTPQLGVVNNLSIPTATAISHLHFSAAPQNAINPETIRRPTKVRWVLNGPEGSWVPIFNEERPIISCKMEGEVDV